MSENKVTLDSNAIWDSSALGTFDGSSSLADEIDSDDDGVITESEIREYKKPQSSPSKKGKEYSVVNLEETPQTYYEINDILYQATESYQGIANAVNEIGESNTSAVSNYYSSVKDTNDGNRLETTKSNVDGLEQIYKDYEVTSGSVDKAIQCIENGGLKSFGIFDVIITKNHADETKNEGDSVKQLIDNTQNVVSNTQKFFESNSKTDDSNEQNKKKKDE